MPQFTGVLCQLAVEHVGMKPWAAGSHFEGVVSSIVGQSISVAAAATTERRLYTLFNAPGVVSGRAFWPPPTAGQLAVAEVETVRSSGVTTRRASALIEIGQRFTSGELLEPGDTGFDLLREGDKLRTTSGVGPWTVRSASLWGLGDPDAHPTGDVALLRAVRQRHPEVVTLRDLDRISNEWRPYRGWAARLYWLDLLGYEAIERSQPTAEGRTTYP
ncbi:MAG: DNA-3-methyladenine glycosylase 2 family protein [Chloroflexia bacterium]|nr:DNA-3-methyladenine glycosylase 2 family protein [Chloroflexia bacterium]